jgi:hypothetical protein
MNVVEECHAACESIPLDLRPVRIDGNGGPTSVKMLYDGRQARDLHRDGNADGVYIARDRSEVDDVGTRLQQAIGMSDSGGTFDKAPAVGERVIGYVDDAQEAWRRHLIPALDHVPHYGGRGSRPSTFNRVGQSRCTFVRTDADADSVERAHIERYISYTTGNP